MRLFECSQKDPCTWRRHQRYEFATKSRLRLERDVALGTSKPGILDAMSHRGLGRMGCEALDFWIVEQNSQNWQSFSFGLCTLQVAERPVMLSQVL